MSTTGRRDCCPHEEEYLNLSGNLPSDILLDILSRLPLKPLSNFRWVCKSWFNLISHSPRFARLHYITNKTSPCVILCNRLRGFDFIDHQVFDNHQISITSHHINLPRHPMMWLLGAANGLLCFEADRRFREKRFNVDPDSYCIFNPIIQEYVILPGPPKPLKSYKACGFGFDSTTGKYKVIGILRRNGTVEADVYTLGSGEWRRIGNVPYTPWDHQKTGVFVNGSLYWVALAGVVDTQFSFNVLSFNVSTEEFRLIQLPSSISMSLDLEVGVLEERLSISHTISGGFLEIWTMKSYGPQESWTKEYVLGRNLMYVTRITGGRYQVAKLSSGELLLSGGQEGRLGYYEPETKIIWYIKIQDDMIRSDRDDRYDWEPIIFCGSLISPKSIEGSRKRLRNETPLLASRPKKTHQNGTSSSD